MRIRLHYLYDAESCSILTRSASEGFERGPRSRFGLKCCRSAHAGLVTKRPVNGVSSADGGRKLTKVSTMSSGAGSVVRRARWLKLQEKNRAMDEAARVNGEPQPAPALVSNSGLGPV
jgi:hypothetical protein